jgi:hypothetical protein
VLLRAGRFDVRSVAALYAAIADAAPDRHLRLEVVRGISALHCSLTLAGIDSAAALQLAETAGRVPHEEHVL